MHNLALCLRNKGYKVTGSDDEIFEPAASNLAKYGLLPEKTGWFPEKIHKGLDAVILGMHARADNPELLKATEAGVSIYSFPAYVYEQIKDKKRVVIAGSHGKTTITSMILHVLKTLEKDFDYLVGSKIKGFDLMVKLTHEAPVAILEGDEYLSSALDKTPKFLSYKPHIALVSGIAWDHINVFPTFDEYVDQFRKFITSIEKEGTLIYNEEDEIVKQLAAESRADVRKLPYRTPNFEIINNRTVLKSDGNSFPLEIIGRHNLQNLEGARLVCEGIGIPKQVFLQSIQNFTGASKRLELVFRNYDSVIYKDFAHSPSKLKATLNAVKEQFPQRKLVACMELHTYSSLNPEFLKQYEGTMDQADVAVVYYNRHTLELKKMSGITPEIVKASFNNRNLKVFTDKASLLEFLRSLTWKQTNLLMMSSGNFDGLDWEELGTWLIG